MYKINNLFSNLKEGFLPNKKGSFLGYFVRNFTLNLIIFLLIFFPLISMIGKDAREKQELQVKDNAQVLALNLMQLENSNIQDTQKVAFITREIVKTQEKNKENNMIKNNSITYYNLSSKQEVANSQEIILLEDEELEEWWKEQVEVKEGIPPFVLNDDSQTFVNKHKEHTIKVTKVYYLNSLVFPSEMKAYKDKKVVDTYKTMPPSTSPTLNCDIVLQRLGSNANDNSYKAISTFNFGVEEKYEKEGKKEEVVLTHPNAKNYPKTHIESIKYQIKDKEYQIDYSYDMNKYQVGHMLMLMLGGILICGASALATSYVSKK